MLVYAPLRVLRRPAIGAGMYFSVSHRPSIQHGRSPARARRRLALPASIWFRRPGYAPGGGRRAPRRFACAVYRQCGRTWGVSSGLQPRRGHRWRSTVRSVCSALQPFGPSPFCKHLHPQFASVDLHRSQARLQLSLLTGLTSACFVPQFAIVALLRCRLQVSFAHWTSASPLASPLPEFPSWGCRSTRPRAFAPRPGYR